MSFAQRLKYLMDERGLTNYQLAKNLDIHPTTVANWLGGKEPRKSTQHQLAKYFGVSTDYLLGESDKKMPTVEGELSDVYFSLAKDLQDNEVNPEDIKEFLEIIKRNSSRLKDDDKK